jgi:anti-anti-sigma regulatory factor
VLKIQRSANGKVVFTLSGRIEEQGVAELQRILAVEKANRHVVLDLKNVTIVDRDAVKFLSRCEAKGMQLANCPAYIREWIGIERPRVHRRNQFR